ncbi:MAG TPA: amidase family protein [Vicinamibacterales bacterium]|jgi:Asp-tRNA(Asn)/Glu-tRNA(Gln) amidotransferase A subunit family amidase
MHRLAIAAALAFLVQQAAAPPLDVSEKSIRDLDQAMASGTATSRQLTEAYLARIAAYDQRGPALDAIIATNPRARDEADALDRERAAGRVRGPLHGIPLLVKDNYDTIDLPTTAASVALKGSMAGRDAFQVKKLRDAGAVILGKTNLHEFARGITTISSLGGQTRNPYDPTRNPGGSSGGTGAAVAASFAAAGLGTDTCGSIRYPAASNNLVGIRPTLGLSSRSGIVPLSHSQDVGGPLGRTVTDVALLLDATVGADPDDPTTAAARATPGYVAHLDPNALRGARLGVLLPYFGDSSDDQRAGSVVRNAVREMAAAGARTSDVGSAELPTETDGVNIIRYEFKFDLNDYLKKTPEAPVRTLADVLALHVVHPSLETALRRSDEVTTLDSDEYRAIVARHAALRAALIALLDREQAVALVYPTLRRTPAKIGEPQAGGNCAASAATGLPAVTVPAGFADDGMPVGVELLGRPFSEADLLALAYSYEQATHHRRPPPLTPPLTR